MKQLNPIKTTFEMDAVARKFINKFGFDEISIDVFDMFIIDQEMAHDPRTSDTADPAYKGFVKERATAKNRLNAAGARLYEDELFQVKVLDREKYVIEVYAANSAEFVEDTGRVLRQRIDNRMEANRKKEKKIITLYKKYPQDPKLQSAMKAIALNQKALNNFTAVMVGETLKIDKVMIAYEQLMLEVDK